MRNTRKSGQILRSKKRPQPTLRSGRGSRTNSNTSYQIQARVIEADSPSAVVYGGADMPLTGPIPEARTVREKTARLKALRLAKEAADLETRVDKKPIQKRRPQFNWWTSKVHGDTAAAH